MREIWVIIERVQFVQVITGCKRDSRDYKVKKVENEVRDSKCKHFSGIVTTFSALSKTA